MSHVDPTFLTAKALEGEVLQQNYKIEKLVGKGGMAWVYRAMHQQLKERVAVKVLQPSLFDDEEIKGRFASEARIQFRMRHPHIVHVTDLIEDGSWVGIVMEWVEGDNLKQFLKRMTAPLSRKDMWYVMAPILDAVGYAHQQGLVHRDIKPANILLQSKQGEIVPKVADFGIAKLMNDTKSDLTSTGMTMGTLKYMAPEQVRDSKNVDHRADIYSLGVTLYMMSTLQPPFQGQQDYIIYQQLHEEPKPPSSLNPSLPKAFDDVVLQCLAKEPVDRFSSCQEVMYALSLSLLSTVEMPRPAEELNLFEINGLIDSLPESSSIYQSSLNPVGDSVLKPLARGAKASPFFVVSQTNRSTTPNPTVLEPTASGLQTSFHQECDTSLEKSDTNTAKKDSSLSPYKVSEPSTPSDVSVTSVEDDTYLEALERQESLPRRNLQPWLSLSLVTLFALGSWLWFKTPGQAALQTSKPKLILLKKTKPTPSCREGEKRDCYTGALKTKGVGLCRGGQQICRSGMFGTCLGEVLPGKSERCDGKDNDCDGQVDEDFTTLGKRCSLQKKGVVWHGVYRCSPDQHNMTCHATKQARALPVLRIVPRSRRFRVLVAGRFVSVKRRLRLNIRRRTKIKIVRKGYYSCFVKVSHRSKKIVVRMRKVDPMGLAPMEDYCRK